MTNQSDSHQNNSSATSSSPGTGTAARMPIRDGRSGKPGASGSSSGQPDGWSEEAIRAGTGGPLSDSANEDIQDNEREP